MQPKRGESPSKSNKAERRKLRQIECEGQPLLLDEKYLPIKLIGSKQGGRKCCKAQDANNHQQRYFIYEFTNLKDYQANPMISLARELGLLARLNRHDNIMTPVDVVYDGELKDQDGVLSVVYPLMSCSLANIRKDLLSIEHVQYEIYLLLRGLFYLHSAGIVHCDIRPTNILINSNDEHKIKNLSSAQNTGDPPCAVALSNYSAPELLLDSEEITTAADIWSAGCIMAELILRVPLLEFNDQEQGLFEILDLVGKPSEADFTECFKGATEQRRALYDEMKIHEESNLKKKIDSMNSHAKDLIEQMLVFNPRKRPTAEKCMRHPFFAELHEESELLKFGARLDLSELLCSADQAKHFLHTLSLKYLHKH